LGDLRGALLNFLIEDRTGKKPLGGNAFCLLLDGLPEAFSLHIPIEEIRATAMRHSIKLRRRILEGSWAKQVPPEWHTLHLLECLDIMEFQKTLHAAKIQDPAPPAQEPVLVRLAISAIR
jgi:hypothetical protein